MEYPQIKVIEHNEELEGLALLIRDVTFARPQGVELQMQILAPWYGMVGNTIPKLTPKPCIVFLQGSAWTTPDQKYEIPQLGWYAQHGFVVATITHRDRTKGFPAPAYLVDTKTAVRFLRANAAQYGIDPQRIGFWGTSSGGNTAMLMAITGDDHRYRGQEYPAYSDAVKAVVECFGPSDMRKLAEGSQLGSAEIEQMFDSFAGKGPDREAIIDAMSPARHIEAGKEYPPMLLIHGDADPVVPYSESETFFHRYIDAGYNANMIRIAGAPHEDSFWSRELHQEILMFFKKYL
ncbi:MAG: alpha/beta hydrolase [Eubacteriales bacterium]|nr:alpha/beta hydrolase [Eubacteriales bacterium]